MNAVKEKAYAKVNLFIDVLAKRDDGFHEIKTVMHTVSLADDVTVTVEPSQKRSVRLLLEGNRRLPTDSKNLAVSAAELFLERAMIDARVTIRLTKNIPVSAGLAGGSTDAAAVLRAMNKLFSRPFAEKALIAMAAQLGSDVPYCMRGGTALCEGRGELITRLSAEPTLHLVVALAHEHVSTPRAYGALDTLFSDFSEACYTPKNEICAALVDALCRGTLPSEGLYNIFEAAVLPESPGAEAIKATLLELGATHALMSGSGPSVFGVFETEQKAKNVVEAMHSLGFSAYYAKSV